MNFSAKGLGGRSIKVTSASCLTREEVVDVVCVFGGVASLWACSDSS